MKVLIGAIGHESNTFTPFLTTLDDFYVRYGPTILSGSMYQGSLQGIIAMLRSHGVELVPTIDASAMPGGVVEQSAYEEFKQAVLQKAQANDIDGVCLYLHGAMRAEGLDYCENDLCRDLRAKLGPDVPISIALDMHANIVAEMVKNVDAMVAYHTAPHIDAYETGIRAAEMLLQILEEGYRSKIGLAKIPFLLPGEMAQTSLDPMATMMKIVKEIEQHPDVLSASLANGHCWADIPDIGVAAVVVTKGDVELAQTEVSRLAAAFWERRAEFGLSAEAYPVEEAIEKAMAAGESGNHNGCTVFLSDSGDNPGAGGTTDVPLLLEKLLAKQATSVLVAGIWDAEAVETCAAAGVGQTVTLSVGGKLDKQHGTPLEVTGRVRLLTDGHYYHGGIRRPPMMRAKSGPISVLNIDGVDVILSSNRLSFVDPIQLRSLGLEPSGYRIVVLKRGYLTAPFQAISKRSILALSPGATNCDVTQMEFHRVNRPMYPLDADATWKPQRRLTPCQ
ncbi:MAG: M81 family metallopeptidase [Chloroflexota bacterium]|nr:M81 family metallopeptidase [Chloroflexota bacterium]